VSERVVHDLLYRAAESHAERTAVVDRHRQLSYLALEERANRLAHLLLDVGVSRGDRVGLFLDKSLESLVGIYGILAAGAAYVPLDPQSPVARLAYIVRDAELRVLISAPPNADGWHGLAREGARLETVILPGGDTDFETPAGTRVLPSSALADYPAARLGGSRQSDLAYILYTSGSTGDPKGVSLSHLNARAFVDWAAREFAVSATDRLSSHAPLHFDLSTFDLFAAAHAGAAVVLVPPELSAFPIEVGRWIDEQQITVWYSVPSALTMLTLRGKLQRGSLKRLQTILFAGEVFPTKYLSRLMELLPHARFVNLYGPTETNVCTWYEVPPISDMPPPSIPIGKAITDVEVLAVDGSGRPVADGEVGELCVVGPTVMQGYWGNAGASARALAPLPPTGLGQTPVYRTGDLVRRAHDGNYLFLGRRDAQVKRRGYRIELGEIESALNAHAAVIECAATAARDEIENCRIVAHVVVRDGVEEAELVEACLDRLPRYALPDAFEFRSELPKTSTGKVDRRSLGPLKAG